MDQSDSCTDLPSEGNRHWSIFEETLDCIEGESFWDNAVYDADLIQQLSISFFSILANFVVLYYYLVAPIHPKFMLRFPRRIAIYLHTLAGTIEILVGVITWFAPGGINKYTARTMAIASLIHSVTGFYQTPIVFGLQAFMVPAYSFVLFCKVLCAISLYLQPYCYIRLIVLFNVLSIYAWCRVFIGIFLILNIFNKSHYTVGILMAGAVCLPGLGPAAFPIGLVYVLLWLIFLRFCTSELTFSLALTENAANPFNNIAFEDVFNNSTSPTLKFGATGEHNAGTVVQESESEKKEEIRRLFHNIDSNGDGLVGLEEIKVYRLALREPKIYKKLKPLFDAAEQAGEKLYLKFEKESEGDSPGFYEYAKGKILSHKVPYLTERIDKINNMPATTNEQKRQKETRMARVVFDIIDTDSTNYLSIPELGVVLLEFGLPIKEVYYLYANYAEYSDEGITFTEFYNNFRPLWRFAFREFKLKLKAERRNAKKHDRLKKSIKNLLEQQKEIINLKALAKQRKQGKDLTI